MGETVGKAGSKEGFTVVAGETTGEAVGVGVGDAVMVGFAEGDPEVEGDTVGVIVDKGVLVAGKVVCVGFHPSSAFAFVGSPQRFTTSVGR